MNSRNLFDVLNISKDESYLKHLNRHNIIYLNFSDLPDEMQGIDDYIRFYRQRLKTDLMQLCSSINLQTDTLKDAFIQVYRQHEEGFIFIIDEWDFIFNNRFFSESDYKKYMIFLSTLLKDACYVEMVYMTGILPIAKYTSGSELNMFKEYTMLENQKFSQFFGFTEQEVVNLCEINGKISPSEIMEWYDGYVNEDGMRLCNPRSVIFALEDSKLKSYWTNMGSIDEVYYFIKNNIEDLKDTMLCLINGNRIKTDLIGYSAEKINMETRQEILSAMVVYGLLVYYNGEIFIPNKELMLKFRQNY